MHKLLINPMSEARATYLNKGTGNADHLEIIISSTLNKDNFDQINHDYLLAIDHLKTIHRKKLYLLFIESTQNVLRHSTRNGLDESIFCFKKDKKEEKYYLITGNAIEKINKKKFTSRIDLINNLSHKATDRLYFQILDNQNFTEKGGAGLGLIQMKRKSNYGKIKYFSEKLEHTPYIYIILEYKISG